MVSPRKGNKKAGLEPTLRSWRTSQTFLSGPTLGSPSGGVKGQIGGLCEGVAGRILKPMSEPDHRGAPPVLPNPAPQTPPPAGGNRYILPILFLIIAGLFIFGGWFISAFNQFASGVTGPAQTEFTEVTLRQGNPEQRIAVIDVTGVITSYGPSDMVATIKKQLKLAAADKRVKAVIIRIDSPGGEVMASDEIARAIREFEADPDTGPVIASMGGMAASGGYYVAAPCRFIVANELTITGSIGVIMQSVNLHGLLDKVGVKPITFKSGQNKDMLSTFNPPETVTPEQKEIIQRFIDETYDAFANVVEEGRAVTGNREGKDARALAEDWRDYADGRILTGKEAHQHGLVDRLGNFDDAVKFTEEFLGIEVGKARLVQHEAPLNFGGLLRFLGKADDAPTGTTVKVDLGMELPRLRPGVPYFLSGHIYAE